MATSSSHKHKILKVSDVVELGRDLVRIADLYPTTYLTETDFVPLVLAYLYGRVPSVQTEVQTREGDIDFKIGGPNPTWLELAVQPRDLADRKNDQLRFPGHTQVSTLYATQNETELRKLLRVKTGKTRFILLVDLTGKYDLSSLKNKYQTKARQLRGTHPVQVVYSCSDTSKDGRFIVKT